MNNEQHLAMIKMCIQGNIPYEVYCATLIKQGDTPCHEKFYHA
ncbi:hypothetical protein HYP06_gp077 [Vibrio phage vB_VspP_pVa5]|uniref:Uncharacterized protein n=1 Tax=Vibrio phage vB_VspP_pVa5 TaxID=1913109 RepID=A0A1J0GVC0_9CAUD|nr:hypothetical protein HYP06_gp077 [Vibrio phage vB_VspP_pVa5]APC46124.1 hypothetical protein vBVspPpVa5_0096 [Vibrio phage vB_VspP_pVa5]